jgi:plastocyanin
VTHSFADASKGAVGVIRVGNPPAAQADAHADAHAAATKLDVTLTDNKITPDRLSMKAGETTAINVTNKGSALHNLRIIGLQGASGKDAQTALLQSGQSETIVVTAPKPGAYKYVCDVHPTEMTGTLTVQ